MLVGDGMADYPIEKLGGKTPLEYASTPNMDEVVNLGCTGRVSTVPQGYTPGSDVANMSLMGYDPSLYYRGRAPIEAVSMGISLKEGDVAFRCNLVTLKEGRMLDYSAGHIGTDEGGELVSLLHKELGSDKVRFYPGVGYRHLMVTKGIGGELACVPPHDITDQPIGEHLPAGEHKDPIVNIMQKAREILADAKVNEKRLQAGKNPATDIWLWGQGPSLTLPRLEERFSLTGSVISAVDLVRGLGRLAGLGVRLVEGATGYLGTNYAGKVGAAREAFGNGEDFVYLHVEAPDETSHEGSLEKKIQAIEEFDTYVVGEMLKYQQSRNDMRIIVLPDHETPLSLKTHSAGPVPWGACGLGIGSDDAGAYNEKTAKDRKPFTGPSLFESFIRGDLQK